MKNFICFPNQFFLQNEFIDTKNAVLTRRRTLPAQLPEMIQIKVHKRCQNFSKTFSSKSSHGEVESSLKAAQVFLGQPAESFPLDIQKQNSV